MNAFDEFVDIATRLKQTGVSYTVIGGVALAFHGHPRFTRDIDLLVTSSALPLLVKTLEFCGYKSFTPPWKLGDSGLMLHRFLKPSPDNEMILDVLEGSDSETKTMIEQSLTAEGSGGSIRVARKEDLIKLKRLRNSLQDQSDIEKLSQ